MADPADPTPPPAAPAASTAVPKPAAPKPTFKVTRSPFAPKIQGVGAPPPPPPAAARSAAPSVASVPAASSGPSVPILSIGGDAALLDAPDTLPPPRAAAPVARPGARAGAAPVAKPLQRGPSLKSAERVSPLAFVVDVLAAAGAVGVAVLMVLEYLKH